MKSSRQQRRKEARQALKKFVTKTPMIMQALYKSDKGDKGFEFALDGRIPEGKNLIEGQIECKNNMVEQYNEMPKEQKAKEVAFQFGLLEQEIEKHNAIIYPNGRVDGGKMEEYTEEAVGAGALATSAIHFLTTIGEIKQDNWNGTQFMYTN